MSIASALGLFVIVFGAILIVCGQIWMLIEAFAESILYGVLCLLFPVAQLIFAAFHPQRAAWPFAMMATGLFVIVAYAFGVSVFA
ncbi:MAG: hypothetical protein H6741_09255 [Alphaproteobacteria bacterium]|nr:hypothetical protein [Alphaproteobacteria bacterium]MCB9792901.1 hypothetical protein [Alphaproteobacteria bacterium]